MNQKKNSCVSYNFTTQDQDKVLASLGEKKALEILDDMLTIRHFEQRGEQAYQMGKVWGFYHSYIGQEAIQTAAVYALGKEKNLWLTTYRCHALALLLGMTVEEGMCELYGKANGNAGGKGGSMHFYTPNMFGGMGIVGGQWPVGAGLAFSLKYQNRRDEIAICFGGDGSVVQGTFHESMNLAKLWELPLLIVIENNQLGMGTQVERAIAALPIGENIAKAYKAKSYTVNGMNFFDMYGTFQEASAYIKEKQEPVILEAIVQRFRGHSISDAAHYRTKEELKKIMEDDPITSYVGALYKAKMITEEKYQERSHKIRDRVIEAMGFADESPFPDVLTLEKGVFSE
ncbi:MAG: pyruvate dehydrogenase (acetyl-transferring) E1 component subunit alpha [Verrucomicrobia bacterium]|nr:pyruvate dehydrogenase (acetyl-transferring) E1 component subunit alpha [Verrucomicrobiota bacterium]